MNMKNSTLRIESTLQLYLKYIKP